MTGTRRLLAGVVLATSTLVVGCARPAVTSSDSSTADPSASASVASATVAATLTSTQISTPAPVTATGAAVSSAVASASGSAQGGVSTPLPQCAADKLPTRTKGVLTVAVPTTLSSPWFSGTDPAAGGLEPAVVAAVADKLGFGSDGVRWVRADPSDVAAGRRTDFDVALGELVIPDHKGGPVDYTTGYFTNSTVVVARAGVVPTASLAGVSAVPLGASGSVQKQAINESVGSSAAIDTFSSAAQALGAVRAGTVGAAAVDAVSGLEAHDLKVLGALPAAAKTADPQLGMATPHNSGLTSCLSTALDVLRVEGTLTSIADQWAPLVTLR